MKWYKISQELPNYYNIETAKNPNTSPELLSEILRRGKDDDVSCGAALNPNTPPEVLSEVLRRGKDDWASRCAARNPNTPPEILAEILRRGNNNHVSQWAARNTKTPPESLSEVLRRGNNDEVSQYVAQNPNTPLDVLSEVLRRGNNDGVSWYAAQNPNTPLEVLTEVLRRGNNDKVSCYAAQNPNTPPQAIELWKILIDKTIDINKYLNDIIQSNDVTKIVNTLKYINLNIVDESIVEDYIHNAFQNLELRNKLLTELPKEFFNKMAMTEENRKIVEEYYGKTKEVTKPSMFENVFAKKMKWYKKSQNQYQTKDGKPITFNEFPLNQRGDDEKGWVYYEISAIIDGEEAGYIKLSYIPKEKWNEIYHGNIWKFRKLCLGRGDLSDKLIEQNNDKDIAEFYERAYPWTPGEQKMKEEKEKAEEDYRLYNLYYVDKPIVDYISTEPKFRRQRVAYALHQYANQWLVNNFGLHLWLSYCRSDSGKCFYDSKLLELKRYKYPQKMTEGFRRTREYIANTFNFKQLKMSQNAQTLYHITHTKNVSKIIKEGIRPLQTSNWVSGYGKRYGEGEIYAFENIRDAIKWAAKMDWEFNTKMGSGKISIIEFNTNINEWKTDMSDPVSQAGSKGRWLKRMKAVKPNEIIKSYPVTPDMIKNNSKLEMEEMEEG